MEITRHWSARWTLLAIRWSKRYYIHFILIPGICCLKRWRLRRTATFNCHNITPCHFLREIYFIKSKQNKIYLICSIAACRKKSCTLAVLIDLLVISVKISDSSIVSPSFDPWPHTIPHENFKKVFNVITHLLMRLVRWRACPMKPGTRLARLQPRVATAEAFRASYCRESYCYASKLK